MWGLLTLLARTVTFWSLIFVRLQGNQQKHPYFLIFLSFLTADNGINHIMQNGHIQKVHYCVAECHEPQQQTVLLFSTLTKAV